MAEGSRRAVHADDDVVGIEDVRELKRLDGFASVDRSSLLEKIVSSNARLVSLIAPAGYGKSTLARAMLGAPSNGSTVDCSDMRGVPDAVRALLRVLGPLDKRLEERQARYFLALPRDGSADDRWIDVLDEALHASSNTRTICIENGEHLQERPAVAGLVDRLVQAGGRRFVVCSRVRLTLPALARIPPNERLDIGIDELRFTPSEIRLLFGIAAAEPLLERITTLSHGWPIAVLTFLRSAREGRLESLLDGASGGSEASGLSDYTLSEALGSLSPEARSVLAAAALLRRIDEDDLRAMTERPEALDEQFRACPFVSRNGTALEVHPLAIAALLPLRNKGERILIRAAQTMPDRVRAAQLYLAARRQDAAADILDTSLAPFMMNQPSPEVAALVASLDAAVLLRHPPTWNATWMARAATVNSQRMLLESRTVWTALRDDDPLLLRFGVGTSLLHWLYFTANMDEAVQVLDDLERAAIAEPEGSMLRVLLEMWKMFWHLRNGRSIDVEPWLPVWASTFATMPMSHAMCLYAIPAPIAFFRGERAKARRIFALAIDLALVPGSETIAAVAIVNAAFHSWLAGEDANFAALLEMLRADSGPNVAPATAHFLGCASAENPDRTPIGTELQYMRAYGWLIAAGRCASGEAQRSALLAAIDAAAGDGQPWLLALTWAALGLADPSRQADAYQQARSFAARVDYPHFRQAIESIAEGTVPAAWPALRKLVSVESPSGRIFVGLGTREVHVGSRAIGLAQREAELLLALCLHGGTRDRRTLAATIWPDLDEKAGSNTVGVYVNRIRRRLGDLDLIVSRGTGYALRYDVDVDVLMLEDAIARGRSLEPLELPLEDVVRAKRGRLPQWVLMSEWLAPYVRRYEAAIRQIRAMRAAAAGERFASLAEHYRNLLDDEAEA